MLSGIRISISHEKNSRTPGFYDQKTPTRTDGNSNIDDLKLATIFAKVVLNSLIDNQF